MTEKKCHEEGRHALNELSEFLANAQRKDIELSSDTLDLIAQLTSKIALCIEGRSTYERTDETEAAEAEIRRSLEKLYNKGTCAFYGKTINRLRTWCQSRGLRMYQLSNEQLQAYTETLQNRFSEQQICEQMSNLRYLYDSLVKGGFCVRNPVTSKRKSPSASEMAPLKSDDVQMLFTSLPTGVSTRRTRAMNLRDRAIIGAIFYAFVPLEILRKLRVGDYITDGKMRFLRARPSKKSHSIPLHPSASTYIDEYLAVTNFADNPKAVLFPATTGWRLSAQTMTTQSMSKALRSAGKRIGITNVTSKQLRLAGVTALLNSNWIGEEREKLMEHYKKGRTSNYPFLSHDTSHLGRLFDISPDISAPLRDFAKKTGIFSLLDEGTR